MLTAFRVKSDRLHTMSIAEGTTVGALKEMLRRNGFDIDATTLVEVKRAAGDILIGQTDTYILQRGDCLKFTTKSVSLVQEPENNAPKKSICETIKQKVKAVCCQRAAGKDSSTENRVTVTETEDGLIIRINL